MDCSKNTASYIFQSNFSCIFSFLQSKKDCFFCTPEPIFSASSSISKFFNPNSSVIRSFTFHFCLYLKLDIFRVLLLFGFIQSKKDYFLVIYNPFLAVSSEKCPVRGPFRIQKVLLLHYIDSIFSCILPIFCLFTIQKRLLLTFLHSIYSCIFMKWTVKNSSDF